MWEDTPVKLLRRSDWVDQSSLTPKTAYSTADHAMNALQASTGLSGTLADLLWASLSGIGTGFVKPGNGAYDQRSLFVSMYTSGTRTFYVDANAGNDSNTGSSSGPYKTVGKALSGVAAGDRILLRSGKYGALRVQNVAGTPSAWVTIMSASDSDTPVFGVAGTDSGTYEHAGIIHSSYVGVYGIEAASDSALGANDANADRSALSIYGGSHHVAVWSSHLHDVPGGGINCFETNGSHDCIDAFFNTIHGTSRRSPSNTSGISINNSDDVSKGGTLDGRYGYRIVANHIYDVVCLVPFTPGGQTVVTDGNGISLDLIYDTHGYVKPILVEGNLVHGCGARALHSYGTINVDALHNIGVGDLINVTNSGAIAGDPEYDSEQGGVTQTTAQAASNLFYGNVFAPTKYGNWRDARSTYQLNVVLVGSQAVDGTNIDRKSAGLGYAPGYSQDPTKFINPASFIGPIESSITRHPRALGYSATGAAPFPVAGYGTTPYGQNYGDPTAAVTYGAGNYGDGTYGG